jgi:hypothetical protein
MYLRKVKTVSRIVSGKQARVCLHVPVCPRSYTYVFVPVCTRVSAPGPVCVLTLYMYLCVRMPAPVCVCLYVPVCPRACTCVSVCLHVLVRARA